MADNMVDLSLSDAERRKMFSIPEGEDLPEDGPKFPFGTELELNDVVLEKLGIDTLPEVGTEILVIAMAKVTGVSSNERDDGEERRNVDLQLTSMELTPPVDPGRRGRILFGGSGDSA